MQLELEQFANRLQQLRTDRGWSQSDLAREVWGDTTNRSGRKVAKNRDRISTYEMGKSWPDPHNLVKLANALGVTPEELAPDIVGSTVERQNPEFAIVGVAGHRDKVHLKINTLVSFDVATKIMQLLKQSDEPGSGSTPNDNDSSNTPSTPGGSHLHSRELVTDDT
jgi:transcriptional regulator with XRE-family HTH domain